MRKIETISEMDHMRHKIMRCEAGYSFDPPTLEQGKQLLAEYDRLWAALQAIASDSFSNYTELREMARRVVNH